MNRSSHGLAASPVGIGVRLLMTLVCAILLTTHAEAGVPPTITSFNPTQEIAGSTVVTIHGTGFVAPMAAKFYGEAAFIGVQVISATELTVTVPGEAITGPIGISGANGTTGTPTNFVVTGQVPIDVIPSFEVVKDT